jgi:haloalkane dehalogenase
MWQRQVPICGESAEEVEVVAAYAAWLAETPGLPKVFINAEPGAVLTGAQRDFCRTWPDESEVTVPGVHFIQEDTGKKIGQAILTWLAGRA